MPHVIVKLWPGKSERQKEKLAERITEDVMEVLRYGDESVSVAFEEISAEDWAEKVYRPDIVFGPGKLYKKPGYRMETVAGESTRSIRPRDPGSRHRARQHGNEV